jgi:hypothetical protein
MALRTPVSKRPRVANANRHRPYGAREHLEWLIAAPEFVAHVWAEGHTDGKISRRDAPHSLRDMWLGDVGDLPSRRARDYVAKVRQRIHGALPPGLRGLDHLLLTTDRAHVTDLVAAVRMSPARKIHSAATVERLQRTCRLLLTRAPGTAEADHKFRREWLSKIDPGPVELPGVIGSSAIVGAPAALHAQSAAVASYVVGASAVGWPVSGVLAEDAQAVRLQSGLEPEAFSLRVR